MKLFSQEPILIKKLDNKLLQIADGLGVADWVDVLNTKSIFRQRNLSVLESCAYNLIKKKDEKLLNIDSIQKCLLSCGILHFHDSQFYKFLLESLTNELNKNESNKNWLEENEKSLSSIISSLGIIQLRDEALLDTLCRVFKNNMDKKKLIINFAISCASLNYEPVKPVFKSLIANIDVNDFDLSKDRKEKINFLTYVWSLCALNCHNQKFVSKVLGEEFRNSLLEGE